MVNGALTCGNSSWASASSFRTSSNRTLSTGLSFRWWCETTTSRVWTRSWTAWRGGRIRSGCPVHRSRRTSWPVPRQRRSRSISRGSPWCGACRLENCFGSSDRGFKRRRRASRPSLTTETGQKRSRLRNWKQLKNLRPAQAPVPVAARLRL